MTDMQVYFQEAEKLFSLGYMKEAEENYTKFISLVSEEVDPSKTDISSLATAYNNRGQIKYLRVDFDEAVEDYTEAIKLKSDFAVALYNRGTIHYRMARFQKGIEDFKAALLLQPDFPDCQNGLKTAQEDMKEAIQNGSYPR